MSNSPAARQEKGGVSEVEGGSTHFRLRLNVSGQSSPPGGVNITQDN